jgi:hypothetical protein
MKKTIPREASLLRSVEIILNNSGIEFRKRHGGPYTTAGDPDLYLVVRGHHVEIELKRPGENPTPLQASRLRQWERAGATVMVIRSPKSCGNSSRKLYTQQKRKADLLVFGRYWTLPFSSNERPIRPNECLNTCINYVYMPIWADIFVWTSWTYWTFVSY